MKNKDLTKLYITFLLNVPEKWPLDKIKEIKAESEDLFIVGREIYLHCPKGYGKTKLSNNLFEKKLKVSATTRNWKTVSKLLELAS